MNNTLLFWIKDWLRWPTHPTMSICSFVKVRVATTGLFGLSWRYIWFRYKLCKCYAVLWLCPSVFFFDHRNQLLLSVDTIGMGALTPQKKKKEPLHPLRDYSVCSLVWARMEEQTSGPIVIKNPNDPQSVYRKAPAIAQNIQNWATTNLVGGWNRATLPHVFTGRLPPGHWAVLTNTNHFTKEIS